ERIGEELRTIVSELLKLPKERISRQGTLADFGFDSIGFGRFAERISRLYRIRVTPAVFFRYVTLEKLGRHLLDEHGERVRAHYSGEGSGGGDRSDGLDAVS